MTFKHTLLATGAVLAASGAASAQTIDYGSLEMLFGEPVTTSATGKPQRASEAPVNMVIVTAEDIRRSGATDIPEALRAVPGVSVQRSTFGGVDVGMRGYNAAFNERVLVLINGRQVYLDHFGYVNWSSLPVTLQEIRQIEIIKGPNTALYGFNATSGVINIITFNPLYDDTGSALIRGGTQGFAEGALAATHRFNDRFAVRLSAGAAEADEFETPLFTTGEEGIRDDFSRGFLSAELLTRLTGTIDLSLEYTRSQNDQGELYFDHSYIYNRYETDSLRANLVSQSRFGVTELSVYQNTLDLSSRNSLVVEEELGVDFVDFDVEQTVLVAEAEHLFKLGARHAVRAFAGYRASDNTTFPVANGLLEQSVISLGGMWDWATTDTLSAVLAVRHDALELSRTGEFLPGVPQTNAEFDVSVNEWSFNLGLVYTLSDRETLRFVAGQGVDLPSPTEFSYLNAIEPKTLQIGDPTLNTSQVRSVEVSYDRALPGIKGSMRLAAFAYQADDLQAIQQNYPVEFPDEIFVYVVSNYADSEAIGLEFAIEGQLTDHLGWYANYLYADVQDTLRSFDPDEMAHGMEDNGHGGEDAHHGEDDDDEPALSPVDFENNSPDHTLNAGLRYTRDRFEFDLHASYTSDRRQLRAEDIIHIEVEEDQGGDHGGGHGDAHGGGHDEGLDDSHTVSLVYVPIGEQLNLNARAAFNVTDNLTLALEAISLGDDRSRQSASMEVERRWNVSLLYRF